MEAIENAIKFITSYPPWARATALGGILVSVLTLVFAPRSAASSASHDATSTPGQTPYWLSIDGVDVFGQEDAFVQITADVNGTAFVYPSLAGVKWAEVGPSMSPQQFQLPSMPLPVRLRFSALLRGKDTSKVQLVSQRTILIDSLPASGNYALYRKDEEGFRGSSISAQVRYTVTTKP